MARDDRPGQQLGCCRTARRPQNRGFLFRPAFVGEAEWFPDRTDCFSAGLRPPPTPVYRPSTTACRLRRALLNLPLAGRLKTPCGIAPPPLWARVGGSKIASPVIPRQARDEGRGSGALVKHLDSECMWRFWSAPRGDFGPRLVRSSTAPSTSSGSA